MMNSNVAISFLIVSLLVASACGDSSSGSKSTGEINILQGTIRYQDKEYDQNGFTGNTSYKAVRYATVELIDVRDGTETVIIAGSTDAEGQYILNFSGTISNLKLRVYAKSDENSGVRIQVNNLSDNLLAVYKQVNASTLNIDIPATNPAAGAFNILDVYTSGYIFVKELSGIYPEQLNVYWEVDNNLGTWYCTSPDSTWCPFGSGIYVVGGYSGGLGDTDHYDDDVLWHEFGHFTAAGFSKDDSPGGQHFLSDNDLDLRLAWSEGWGGFFTTAIKAWLESTDPALLSKHPLTKASFYVDTVNDDALISMDIGNPGSLPYMYSSNEVAIAKVLWEINASFGTQPIWDILEDYLPSVVSSPVSMETFWDGWLEQRTPDTIELSQLENIFTERYIYYLEDSDEVDDTVLTAKTATVGTAKTHYSYKADGNTDQDVKAFTATAGTQYTIETYCLKNGADTYIMLLDSNGNTLDYDDDRSDSAGVNGTYNNCPKSYFMSFASKITFTPNSTDTYYVQVKTSPEAPSSAGKYGTYTLEISD